MNKSLIFGAVVIIAGIAGYYLYSSTATVSENTNENSDTTSAGMLAEENAVVVSEQKPGSTVTGSIVYLAAPGFLVIHEDADGAPGAILGASAVLQAGENTEVPVTLSRASREGETLYAMLHTDTDANGSFDAAIDIPVESILGGPIQGWFEITSSASITVPVSI
ncbi:hypothetical protein C4585_03525 [Candidatus Parcubacteria bacterium]|nr:MAG: hypothetical protein C4585_03525 [Candidatus Parcubacteria bacterium]